VLVSVLIDTYNHENFIEHAIASVLQQDFPEGDREIVVVDDGSTDRTPEIVRGLAPCVRLIRKKNGGQASAFNVGIPECRGEIIAFLDGDDWWAPGKLRRVTGLFAGDPALGFVGHSIIESYSDGTERPILVGCEKRFRIDSIASAEFFRMNRCFMGTSRMIIRTEIARRILPVPESLVFEADEYLFTLAPAMADAILIPDALMHYRLHGGNLYMSAATLPGGERRKERVFSALAKELHVALPKTGIAPEVVSAALAMLDAEAAQLRLKLDGGAPWETFRTESALYRMQHPGASWRSKAFRTASMVPALVLPPTWFYAGRQWLGSQSWYKQFRKGHVPVPQTKES